MPAYLVKRPNGREQVMVAQSDMHAVAMLRLPMLTRTFRAVDRIVTVQHNWTGETLATVYPVTDEHAHDLRVEHLNDAQWTINPSQREWVLDAYERLVNAW